MRADLHLHTVYSDGLRTPDEVARKAKKAGVELICFTDHDTMAGAEEKRAAAKKYGLQYLEGGWEISAYLNQNKIHVLGYGCQKNEAYRQYIEEQKDGAKLRLLDIIEKANEYFGYSVTFDEVLKERLNESAVLHVMHVVRVFARKLNLLPGDVYAKYFGYGKPAFSDLYRPTPQEAIDVIHATEGFAFLAHPGRIFLSQEELKNLLDDLVLRGLDGIECHYTTHTTLQTEYFLRYAKERNLLVSGGSDFHAEDDTHFVGKPIFYPDEKLLQALKPSLGGGD